MLASSPVRSLNHIRPLMGIPDSIFSENALRGSKASEIPIELPTKFELVVNLKTAKALGLDVPLHLQQLADEVIE
jgi:putative ABC transport system substrate-binding protein